jgi:pre-mRNA-splicing factor CWC22
MISDDLNLPVALKAAEHGWIIIGVYCSAAEIIIMAEDHPPPGEEEVPFVDYEGEEDDDDENNNVAVLLLLHPHPGGDDEQGGVLNKHKHNGGSNKDTPSSLMDRPLAAPRYSQPDENNNNGQQPHQRQQQSPREHVGAYIPPAKRRLLEEQQKQQQQQQSNQDNQPNETKVVTPIHIQRQTWETLQRTINGTINRLNVTTIKPLIHSLFQKANLIRGRGILIKSILNSAMASPNYAHVYVALLAVINTKLPECGELLVTRSILAFRKGYQRRDRMMVSSILGLLGHLFNQGLTHELLSLQLLTILLDGDPTDDSVDVAVGYMCIVGKQLSKVSPAGVHAVMERFRGLLHEGTIGRRGQYRIETLLKIKRGGFVDYPTLPDEEYLDLVEREDQITFELGLDDDGLSNEEYLDVFRFDEEYDENEREWERIRAEILGEDDSSSGSDDESGSESGSEEEVEDAADQVLDNDKKKTVAIQDLTETDLVHLRRTIYLTIMSSATFEECTHKLAKMDIPQGREHELINMIIECCSQERTFLRYYGLVSGRFCLLHERWQDAFESAFATQYNTIHRLETNKLRNVAKLFGHLLHTDSISWSVLSCIHLNEDETTSSSRIFLKILVQEMAEAMGMLTLKQRFDTDNPDPDGLLVTGGEETAALATITNNSNPDAVSSREWFKGMFPKDNARNTRYAINFFTSIGLGPLTDGMREFLKNAPKLILAQAQAQAAKEAKQKMDDSDASSVISSSSSDTSSFDSSSSSSFSSSSSSSYTSSSSYSSYSSDSRRKKRSSRRGRDRKRGRSHRSYSSSSSGSDSETSSRRGRGKTSSKGKRDTRRSRSRSPSNGSSGGKKRRSRDKSDIKTPDASKTSSKRSVSQSPAGSRSGRNRRRRRSYTSSRSRSRSSRKSNDQRNSRSSENPIHELPAELKERQSSRKKRRRRSPSSSSSASESRSPSRDKKYSRREDRKRRRSRSRSASSGRD